MVCCNWNCGNVRADVGSTNYPTTECPKDRSVKLDWDGGKAGCRTRAHCDRLRKRKSKRSENKPQKLLWPLGNLLKAHKTRVCYNTWSYNGDPFQILFFCAGHFFFFLFFSTGRGTLTRDWLLKCYSAWVLKANAQPEFTFYSYL